MTSEPTAGGRPPHHGRVPDHAAPARAAPDGPGPGTSDPGGATVPVDERRLHPAWILTRAVGVLRGLVPAFVALAVGLREWAVPAALLLSAVVVFLRALEWWATRYAVVDGTLRVRSGVLARRERVVPASRISALDTSRGPIQRAFGLVALEVQTAGGGRAAELRLDTLTVDEAERLRAALGHAGGSEASRSGRSAASSGPATAPTPDVADPAGAAVPDGATGSNASPAGRRTAIVPGAAAATGAGPSVVGPAPATVAARPGPGDRVGETDYAITGRQLVTAALTGPQLGLVVVLVGSVLSQGQDLLPRGLTDRVEEELTGANAMTVAVAVVLAVLAAAAVSVVGTVLAFAEFTVVRDHRRLRVRRGLLTERTGTIPLDRIHGVRIVEGLLRRPLGYATVQVEVAGYRGDSELTRTLVPLVHRSELPSLLARMLPELPRPDEPVRRPPARARRRYWLPPLLASLVPAAVLVLALPSAWWPAALVAPALGLVVGESRWRGAGWALGPSSLVLRSQLVARTTLLVVAARVQQVRRSTTPFQRRAGLSTVRVALATRRIGEVRHLDDAVADDLQRAVAARATRPPPPGVRRGGSLSSVAPPE